MVNLRDLIDDAGCLRTAREMRRPDLVACPHCSSEAVIKDGRDDTQPDRQRYLCRSCRKRFDDLTGTTVATGEGWLYLAAVEDLYSRRIVRWSMSERIDSRLVVDALEMALAGRQPGDGLVAHSDRGSQYASEHYQRVLAGRGITCSMSRRGNCWDNAPMESFFASLKKELTRGEIFPAREEARSSLFESIEVFYNRIRRHSSLGYRSPIEYERAG